MNSDCDEKTCRNSCSNQTAVWINYERRVTSVSRGLAFIMAKFVCIKALSYHIKQQPADLMAPVDKSFEM